MKRYYIFLVALSSLAQHSYGASTSPIESAYITKQESYEECKNSIQLADRGDLRGFLRSYCASQITGYLAGYLRMLPTQQIEHPKADYNDAYQEFYESYNSVICIPKEWWNSNELPIELRVAKDLMPYMEQQLEKPGNASKPNIPPFVSAISTVYSCNPVNSKK